MGAGHVRHRGPRGLRPDRMQPRGRQQRTPVSDPAGIDGAGDAWFVLRPGFAPSEALAREIQDFVKVQLAAHEYPRVVQFAESLPMTATGKVLRRELRALG